MAPGFSALSLPVTSSLPSKPRFEVAFVPLNHARALVELYAEKGDPK